jgi:hypothetical protein
MNTEKIILTFLNSTSGTIESQVLKDTFIDNIDIAISKSFHNEQNSVNLEINSNDDVTAESIKLYNVFKFSQKEFLVAVLGITSTIIPFSDSFNKGLIATTSSLLALLLIFRTNLSKKYSTIDSEVLCAIYHLNKSSNIIEIQGEYESRFSKKIKDNVLENSINLLIDYQTIKFENNLITLNEVIILKRV